MNKMQKTVVLAALMLASGIASAALPAEATAAFSSLSDNAASVLAAVWPILATVTGGFALMTLFKKGTGKAV